MTYLARRTLFKNGRGQIMPSNTGNLIIGSFMTAILVGCAPITPALIKVQASDGSSFQGFSISKDPGSTEPNNLNSIKVFFTKNNDRWTANANGDLSNESTELLIIDYQQKKVSLGTIKPVLADKNDVAIARNAHEYMCEFSVALKSNYTYVRSKTAYDFCKSSLKMRSDNATTAVINTVFTPLFAVLGVSSAFYVVDTDAIQRILQENEGAIGLISQQSKEQFRAAQERARIAQVQWEKDRPTREKAETARLRAKEIAQAEMLAQTKVVGQKICQDMPGTYAPMIGTVMGEPNYDARPRQTTYFVTAFTERVNGDRVNLRVGGVQRLDFKNRLIDAGNLSVGGITYSPGAVLWDDLRNWRACQ